MKVFSDDFADLSEVELAISQEFDELNRTFGVFVLVLFRSEEQVFDSLGNYLRLPVKLRLKIESREKLSV